MILIKETTTMTALKFILYTQKSFRWPAGTQFVKKETSRPFIDPQSITLFRDIFFIFPAHQTITESHTKHILSVCVPL